MARRRWPARSSEHYDERAATGPNCAGAGENSSGAAKVSESGCLRRCARGPWRDVMIGAGQHGSRDGDAGAAATSGRLREPCRLSDAFPAGDEAQAQTVRSPRLGSALGSSQRLNAQIIAAAKHAAATLHLLRIQISRALAHPWNVGKNSTRSSNVVLPRARAVTSAHLASPSCSSAQLTSRCESWPRLPAGLTAAALH